MPVRHSRRQIGQVSTDNEGLGAKLSRGVGDIDAVAIGVRPIGHHKSVMDRLEAGGCGAGGGDRIDVVPAAAQDIVDLAGFVWLRGRETTDSSSPASESEPLPCPAGPRKFSAPPEMLETLP